MSNTPAQPPRVSQLAWAAFICAVIFCVPLLGVVAIVLGSFALGRIRNSQGTLGGRKIALLAMGIGAATSVGWILGLNQFQSWYHNEMNSKIEEVITSAIEGAQGDDFKKVRNTFTLNAEGLEDASIATFGASMTRQWGRLIEVTVTRSIPQGEPMAPRMAVTFELEFEGGSPSGAANMALLTTVGQLIHEPHLLELEIFSSDEETLRLGPGYDEQQPAIEEAHDNG